MIALELIRQPAEFTRPSFGGALIFLWLFYRVDKIFRTLKRKSRRASVNQQPFTLKPNQFLTPKQKSQRLRVVQHPTRLGRWLGGVMYLYSAPEILLANYDPDIPFAVPTPESMHVHVSSENHLKELSEGPEEKLSLHAFSKDLLQPKYTMGGLEVSDQMSLNGSLHYRVLRVVLKSHLQELQAALQHSIAESFLEEFHVGEEVPGADDWRKLKSFSMAKNVIRTANSIVFFGNHLSNNLSFLTAAMQYPDDVLFTSEVLRLTPGFLAPVLAPLCMRQGRGQNLMVEHLMPLVQDRMTEQADGSGVRHLDCIQWIIDVNPRKNPWSAGKIIQVLLGLWFASVHQLAISVVYALEDLCSHSEYMDAIREEIVLHTDSNGNNADLENMPLIDSFLKESARLRPSDSISVRRKALQPYTFSDGVHVAPGNVVCAPMRAMMLDEKNFPNSRTFDAYRFVKADGVQNHSKMVDGDPRFLLWGLGKRACPGRYYAVHALKLCLVHAVTHWEMKMGEEPRRTFNWRSATVPRAGATLLFRQRTR